jgi:hypothetical protein
MIFPRSSNGAVNERVLVFHHGRRYGALRARFESEDGGIIGDARETVSPGEEFYGVPYAALKKAGADRHRRGRVSPQRSTSDTGGIEAARREATAQPVDG